MCVAHDLEISFLFSFSFNLGFLFKISPKYWCVGSNYHKITIYKYLIQIASFSIFLMQQTGKSYYPEQFEMINIYLSSVVICYREVSLCLQHKFISTVEAGANEVRIVTLMMFFKNAHYNPMSLTEFAT